MDQGDKCYYFPYSLTLLVNQSPLKIWSASYLIPKKPSKDHPTSSGMPFGEAQGQGWLLPVAHLGEDYIELINSSHPSIKKFHADLEMRILKLREE